MRGAAVLPLLLPSPRLLALLALRHEHFHSHRRFYKRFAGSSQIRITPAHTVNGTSTDNVASVSDCHPTTLSAPAESGATHADHSHFEEQLGVAIANRDILTASTIVTAWVETHGHSKATRDVMEAVTKLTNEEFHGGFDLWGSPALDSVPDLPEASELPEDPRNVLDRKFREFMGQLDGVLESGPLVLPPVLSTEESASASEYHVVSEATVELRQQREEEEQAKQKLLDEAERYERVIRVQKERVQAEAVAKSIKERGERNMHKQVLEEEMHARKMQLIEQQFREQQRLLQRSPTPAIAPTTSANPALDTPGNKRKHDGPEREDPAKKHQADAYQPRTPPQFHRPDLQPQPHYAGVVPQACRPDLQPHAQMTQAQRSDLVPLAAAPKPQLPTTPPTTPRAVDTHMMAKTKEKARVKAEKGKAYADFLIARGPSNKSKATFENCDEVPHDLLGIMRGLEQKPTQVLVDAAPRLKIHIHQWEDEYDKAGVELEFNKASGKTNNEELKKLRKKFQDKIRNYNKKYEKITDKLVKRGFDLGTLV
ncbi:hypothetical protein BU23DRAFT_627704 [Bimuria novae-zelandiae CBS 107.79]|uniref:Uncharacterized protein n=1 Tax=Bimuria novae-zelandiae CBS 107.79 TaxID=1447943 RepID=A0A6A5UM11_9PLEO|nr:hypothetical protein BU23DRAFT_627704 [Bimuria novae-zelandiae CBS 107.79]